MGTELKKVDRVARRRLANAKEGMKKGVDPEFNRKVGGLAEKNFRKGTSSKARNAANEAEKQLEKQQQAELLKRVESEDEIARRRGLAKGKSGGRRSLISSSSALSSTLGG